MRWPWTANLCSKCGKDRNYKHERDGSQMCWCADDDTNDTNEGRYVMGLDLRLLPCESWNALENKRTWGFSHTVLEVGGVSEAAWLDFQETVKPHLSLMPPDHNVSSWVGALITEGPMKGEKSYGRIRAKDAYGEAFQYALAEQLSPWLDRHFAPIGFRVERGYRTAAAAYVRALPPDTRIVLDWH